MLKKTSEIVEALGKESDWLALSLDRENWRQVFMMTWFRDRLSEEKEKRKF